MDYYDILNQATELGLERHPKAPIQHHMTFASVVAILVTGETDDLTDGPSMREHLACQVAKQKGKVGTFSFDEAVRTVETVCYGPLTYEHACMLERWGCADDAPGERDRARRILQAMLQAQQSCN